MSAFRRTQSGYTNRMKSLSLAVLAILSIAGTALAQTGTVNGTVSHSLSGAPVRDALVIIESPTFTSQARTTADGKYAIADLPIGAYRLVVRAAGYIPSRTDVTVAAGSHTADVRLDPDLHFADRPDTPDAIDVMRGQERAKELQPTVGGTLELMPGFAARSFGPATARPVVRGLDGDRILILENGLRTGDLSSQSADHAVPIDPAQASRIDVIRGPAMLLYGANAIGTALDVVTNAIPSAPVAGASGSFTADAASNGGQAGVGGELTVGTGKAALHVGGSGLRADDYRSADGDVPNSFQRSGSIEAGVSATSERGYFGGGVGWRRWHYGIPLVDAGAVSIEPEEERITLRGERRGLNGAFDSVRGAFNYQHYTHDETTGARPVTSFTNDTTNFELVAHHRAAGRMSGAFAGSIVRRSFEASGPAAPSPAVDQQTFAGSLFEDVAATPMVHFQFASRVDHNEYNPKTAAPKQKYDEFSGSMGLLVLPTDATTVAVTVSRASRSPALEELFFNGPHAGSFVFEIGDPSLDSEHALGLDASFRWRAAPASGEVAFFMDRIDNFIFRAPTGGISAGLPETRFVQGDAKLQGIESHFDARIITDLWFEAGLDIVHGTLTGPDLPLPRIPPMRSRLGARYQSNAFQLGGEAVLTAKQDRVFSITTASGSVSETATEGYRVVRAFASYSLLAGKSMSTITARVENAADTSYRNHLNLLKDFAPEMGRNFRIVYTVKF